MFHVEHCVFFTVSALTGRKGRKFFLCCTFLCNFFSCGGYGSFLAHAEEEESRTLMAVHSTLIYLYNLHFIDFRLKMWYHEEK